MSLLLVGQSLKAQQDCTGWQASYFNNADLSGLPAITTCDAALDFDWGEGVPVEGINADGFSVRWVSTQTFAEAGTYEFNLLGSDEVRLFVNGVPIINAAGDVDMPRTLSASYDVQNTGQPVFLVVEASFHTGSAQLKLDWARQQVPTLDPNLPTTGGGEEWHIEYYSSRTPQGKPTAEATYPANGISRNYAAAAPAEGMGVDNWSGRWTRPIDFPAGDYTFTARVNTGMRLLIDGVEMINQPEYLREEALTVTVAIPAGRHIITVEHYETEGDANLFVTWEPAIGTNLLPSGCNGVETAGINGNAPPCPGQFAGVILSVPVTVRAGPLNFRAAPNQEAETLASLSQGEQYTAVGRSMDNLWIQLNVNGVIGWAMAEFLTLEGEIDRLSITDGTVQ